MIVIHPDYTIHEDGIDSLITAQSTIIEMLARIRDGELTPNEKAAIDALIIDYANAYDIRIDEIAVGVNIFIVHTKRCPRVDGPNRVTYSHYRDEADSEGISDS